MKIDGLRNIATDKEFQAEALLNNYLYNNNLTSNVQITVLAAAKSFYKANWRELNSNVGSNIESPEPKKRTPKMQDILELDEAMTYHRDKAILWFLESAPFRKATLTKLRWKDLKSTEAMLKDLREEAKGQVSRKPEEDAEIAEKVPYYLVIESARLKGGGKGKILTAVDTPAYETMMVMAEEFKKEKVKRLRNSLEAYVIKTVLCLGYKLGWHDIPFADIWKALLRVLDVTDYGAYTSSSADVELLGYTISKKQVGGIMGSVLLGEYNLRRKEGRTWKVDKENITKLAMSYGINVEDVKDAKATLG